MSKRPVPWKLNNHDVILDANERFVCTPTLDPETRAVLLHAGEMFAALKAMRSFENTNRDGDPFGSAGELLAKIEAEIAAGKGKP